MVAKKLVIQPALPSNLLKNVRAAARLPPRTYRVGPGQTHNRQSARQDLLNYGRLQHSHTFLTNKRGQHEKSVGHRGFCVARGCVSLGYTLLIPPLTSA